MCLIFNVEDLNERDELMKIWWNYKLEEFNFVGILVCWGKCLCLGGLKVWFVLICFFL